MSSKVQTQLNSIVSQLSLLTQSLLYVGKNSTLKAETDQQVMETATQNIIKHVQQLVSTTVVLSDSLLVYTQDHSDVLSRSETLKTEIDGTRQSLKELQQEIQNMSLQIDQVIHL